MPPQPPLHDPFNPSVPLERSLRGQASQQSLRSNTSTTSGRHATRRLRPPRSAENLFASTLSRRPTGRATPRIEDEVLADPSAPEDGLPHERRRVRHGSPVKSKQDDPLGGEIVNRRENGSYFLESSGDRPSVLPAVTAGTQQAIDMADQDAHLARIYFTSGHAMAGRQNKKQEEEFEAVTAPMMLRLREQAMLKIESERWLFEPAGRGAF